MQPQQKNTRAIALIMIWWIAAGSAPAAAQATHQVTSISSALAQDAARVAKEACLKMGFRVSVTIVDAAGMVLATLREDGAAPHTVSTSQRKAYTAASARQPTAQLVKTVAALPDAFGLRQIDGFLLLSGGQPIKSGESVIGAIGVSGASGPESDDKCGAAALESIAVKLKGT